MASAFSMAAPTTPKRVFISVSRRSLYHSNAWESSDEVVLKALDAAMKQGLLRSTERPTPRLLVKERWQRIHLVADVFHDAYDPAIGHLPETEDLPVIAVFLTGDEDKVYVAGPELSMEVNQQVREHHNQSGLGSLPPFVADHANGNVPTYPNPRTLVKATQSGSV